MLDKKQVILNTYITIIIIFVKLYYLNLLPKFFKLIIIIKLICYFNLL